MTRPLRRRQSPPLPAVRQPGASHLAPPVSPCMLKSAGALSPRARARHDNYVGVEQLTLALVAMNQAIAPRVPRSTLDSSRLP